MEQLGQQLTELSQGDFTVAELTMITQQLGLQDVPASTTAKLAELTFIYDHYQTEISQNFVTNEQLLAYLIAQVKQRQFKQYFIYLTGFSHFNQQQLTLIKALAQQQAQIYLTLYLPMTDQNSATNYYFHSSYQTLAQLGVSDFAALATDERLPATKSRLSPELAAVENFWISSTNGTTLPEAPKLAHPGNLQVWQATSITSEVRAVANYIRELVALQHYRFRDFLVVADDLSQYTATIEALFRQNDIAYFNDLQTPMANHPFVVFMRSLLQLSQGNFQLTDLFAWLRTELLLPESLTAADFREQLDLLENYAIAYGIRPEQWFKTNPWHFQGPYQKVAAADVDLTPLQQNQLAAIEGLHQFVAQSLGQWRQQVKALTTGREFATGLYQFLEHWGVLRQLQQWEQASIASHNLVLAQRPQQTYQAFVDLLDDYVTVWGERAFDLSLFTDLLNAGFDNTEFAQIPATLDAVLISEMGMVQNQDHRITIVLGATRENMPQQRQAQQLIDDQERALINQVTDQTAGPQLQPTTAESAVDLPLQYGTVFFSGSERLIFTYPSTDSSGANNEISPYVQRIQQYFKLGEPTLMREYPPLVAANQAQEILGFAASKRAVSGQVLLLARQLQDQGQTLPTPWQWVVAGLTSGPDQVFYRWLQTSLNYRNQPVDLSPENVTGLYGQHLYSSVSQLETYYRNPYEYFLQFGLKLRPRQLYQLNSADTGTFFHDYLDHFIKTIAQQQLNLAKLSGEQLTALNQQITTELLASAPYQMLNGPGQMHYYARRLTKTSAFMTQVISEQAKHTIFQPFKTEVQFGVIAGQAGLTGIEIALPNQTKLSVRGKIDRIDLAKIGQEQYYQVIDYKSGQKKFDYTLAYYGLSLQLLTYLQSVANNLHQLDLNQTQPAGAFYLHIGDTPVKYQSQMNVLQEILDQHRYQGLLVDAADSDASSDYLGALDPQAIEQKSWLYPINYLKSKQTYKMATNNVGITPTELEQLLQHNQHLLRQAATDIFAGKLSLAPYRLSNKETGLQYSDFKTIMMFDAMLPENRYRQLTSLDKKDVFTKLQEEQQDD
ncbi:MAG: PD-(D/E)XK nuclease family protein [Lactobacillaceae bacterium]|nr:PD-(D/E)XK nuclease family protein [Lactobacillaceae bacterium]